MTCFGLALVISMVIYVGLSGSAIFGALILFLFSMGMGIPLLIGALAMTKLLPLLGKMEKWVNRLGLVSALLMVGFAILLVNGNYMIISEWATGHSGGLPCHKEDNGASTSSRRPRCPLGWRSLCQ